jgi:hypothetical protein
MTQLKPAPIRPTRRDTEPEPEPEPEGGLTVFLWVVAALIGLAEVIWWMSERALSP